MNDAEISRKLALAIGWESDQMTEHMGSLYVADWPRKDNRKAVLLHGGFYVPPLSPWDKFDYRDPSVIWPIAERFNLFPGRWLHSWVVLDDDLGIEVSADTASKAVALAVIKHHEGSKA